MFILKTRLVKMDQNPSKSIIFTAKIPSFWRVISLILRWPTGHLDLDLTGGHSPSLPLDEDRADREESARL